MALGDVADYLIGLLVERVWPQASLLTFLALYFVSLWIAWLLAVKLTEPKASKQAVREYSLSSLPKNASRFAAVHSKHALQRFALVNSIAHGADVRAHTCAKRG